jgi:DNA polymerase/3'-5' exonuclease PolX
MHTKAYKNAEENILSLTQAITVIKDLQGPGIGPTIKTKLQEYIDTGKIKVLEENKSPPEISMLL